MLGGGAGYVLHIWKTDTLLVLVNDTDILNFYCLLPEVLCSSGCLTMMCDVAADSFKRRDFVNENRSTVLQKWLPLKNIMLTVLNYR